MFIELAHALGHSESEAPREALVCITDSFGTSGDCVLVHFLSLYIRANFRVILASHRHTRLHYAHLCKKLGLNLAALAHTGQFFFVDGLAAATRIVADPWRTFESSVDAALTASAPAHTVAALEAATTTAATTAATDASNQVELSSASPASTASASLPVWSGDVLIWDGVSELCMQHCSDDNASAHALASVQRLFARFSAQGVRYCYAHKDCSVAALLTFTRLLFMQGSLVVMAHGDCDTEEALLKILLRRAAFSVALSPLATGASRVVSGQLSVGGSARVSAAPSHYHYKLTETALRVFVPGSM